MVDMDEMDGMNEMDDVFFWDDRELDYLLVEWHFFFLLHGERWGLDCWKTQGFTSWTASKPTPLQTPTAWHGLLKKEGFFHRSNKKNEYIATRWPFENGRKKPIYVAWWDGPKMGFRLELPFVRYPMDPITEGLKKDLQIIQQDANLEQQKNVRMEAE